MINAFLDGIFNGLDLIYNFGPIGAFFDMLEDFSDMLSSYRLEITHVLEGIYFITGKQLVIFVLTCFGIICVFKLIMAIVNLVYP
jgi:hypothetical protein